MFLKMHKTLSVLSLVGFIISSIKADAPYQPASQSTQVAVDTPQTSYAPAATAYQNSDTISHLNNQAYDSSLYTSFVPQDAVQQYVSQYAGNYPGQILEGILIPSLQKEVVSSTPTFITLIKSLLPGQKIILAVIAKLIALAASAIGVIFFGGAITSFICAFTPLCTITFLGPLAMLRQETKNIVEKIGAEVTPERIKRASDLFKLAIDKYSQMQNA